MSDSGSEPAPLESPAFAERDDAETRLPFGEGRVPLYVAIVWVGFIAIYIIVMAVMALPDLRKWMAH